jgi:hypothetical protein
MEWCSVWVQAEPPLFGFLESEVEVGLALCLVELLVPDSPDRDVLA